MYLDIKLHLSLKITVSLMQILYPAGQTEICKEMLDENMLALNVDYIAWIIVVLGAINSNHTFIFDLNYLLWKLKTSKTQVVSFLLETRQTFFRFKAKAIPRIPVQDAKSTVASIFLSPTLNFQSHLRPAGRNFGAPKTLGGTLLSSFGVLGCLRGS